MLPSCPDAASLQGLLDGTVAETVQADLSQHLESCVSCRAALDKLATDGRSLLGLARDLHPTLTPAEPGLQRVLNEAGGAVSDETQAEPRDDNSVDLAFLAPSSKPGSLGRLGHYEVLEVLGQGGFGIVVKAFDEMLHRVVAIKIMFLQLAATSPARKRFLREARAAAAIRHENVVAIHAVEEKPLPYLVMEYIPGQTLQHKLDQTGPLDVVEVLRLGCQIANGLAAAHGMGLIHRDIKPSNILLESGVEPQVKITDFGLARAADDASLTQSGVIAGTPMYMAPEQAQGEHIDHRADLFSLGSVLYVMCSGRPPFRATTTLGVLKRVAEDTPRPIRAIIPEVPEWLCAIVAKLHAKTPGDRFQTAKEVAGVLAKYLAEVQAHGVLPLDPERTAGARPVLVPQKQDSPRYSPRLLKRRWAIGAGVFALLSLTIGTLLFLNRNMFMAPNHANKDPNGQPSVDAGNPPPLAVAPFDAAKAKEHQEAWAKHLGVAVEITNSIGMKLRLIPPGEYLMGSSPAEIAWLLSEAADLKDAPENVKHDVHSEGPQRRVTVATPFYAGMHEVTVGQFREFVRATSYRTEAEVGHRGAAWNIDEKKWENRPEYVWNHPVWSGGETHPVVFVTPDDAQAFCAWLGKQENRRYALPSEEQWEWACRAGTNTRWFFGNEENLMRQYGWTLPVSGGGTKAVGQLAPNPFGLFDVYGNVTDATLNPQQQVVLRGGDTGTSPQRARSASRVAGGKKTTPSFHGGFRVTLVGDLKSKSTEVARPFVILAKNASAERKYVTLAEAIAAAEVGDTIEIRGNGPFVTGPIVLAKKALTIRAGNGYRPHLRLRPDVIDQSLLRTDAALVLEGMTLEATGKRTEGYPRGVIFAANAELHITHCRLLGSDDHSWAAVRTQAVPAGSMQNCILGNVSVGIDFDHLPRKARFILSHNVIHAAGHVVFMQQTATDVEDVSIHLRNNTFLSNLPISFGFTPPLNTILAERPNPKVPGLRLEASGNILDSDGAIFFVGPVDKSLSLEKVVPLLPRLVSFQDDDNLYSITDQPFLSVNRDEEPKSLRDFKTLAEWHQFWGTAKSTSRIGLAQFQGGDLRAKDSTSPGQLAPADFRLVKGSAGQGAGPGGKDLGADVDLVGPGPAYERWTKTPEHQEWRNQVEKTKTAS